MEEICERENLLKALKQVRRNQGSPGIDGMTVFELKDYLISNWPRIREELLTGTYRPQPVKRVEIPKKNSDKVRELGIPTVLDRFIQQAIQQVLQKKWDPIFSDRSFGFRTGKSAHGAITQAQNYIHQGYRWVVDLDIEKLFDRVNHDILMFHLARRIGDKRVLKAIRAFLESCVMKAGLVSPTDRGTPQGGPLSPLLPNILLDELDKELEKRGHAFVRYADDCNVYVRSLRAGKRVLESISSFLEKKFRLNINREKSAVGRPWRRIPWL